MEVKSTRLDFKNTNMLSVLIGIVRGVAIDRDLNAAINIHKLAVGETKNKKLNLRVAGSIKARGVESTGEVWLTVPYATMLQGNENRVKPKDTQVLYAGNGLKTTTLLA